MKENAYLIIHGFAGGLFEIDYLAQYLRSKNLDTYTVLLAGHGGTKKELKNCSHIDWLKSAARAFNKLKKSYKFISIIGFSMGGLISSHFFRDPAVDKIVFINTPIRFWNIKIILGDVIRGIHSRKYEKLAFYKNSVLRSSMKSNIDFLIMLSVSKKLFSRSDKPALIVQCKNDESAHYKSAEYIKNKIGNNAVLQYYDGGCHLLFNEPFGEKDTVCEDIYKFLVELR